MYSRILRLRFSPHNSNKPIVCRLVKDFDLTFNILNAAILPRKDGVLVLELSGERKNFKAGVQYLRNEGVDVSNAAQEVNRDDTRCTHCGSCTAVCATGALIVKRPEMEVVFDRKKCSVCELCVRACPPRAMQVRPTETLFFP